MNSGFAQPGMSGSFDNGQAAIQQLSVASLVRLSLVFLGAIVLSVAGLFGGMEYLIIALALGLAVVILREPQEAVAAGWLFMLAAMTLLPARSRFHFLDSQTIGIDWQQYYWAAGSLIVTLAALYSIGLSRLLRAPRSCKAFLLVAIASGIFGFVKGNDTSYVIRQLYGSILFVLYFAIAHAAGNEEVLFRRLRTFGVLIALAFIVYYISVFHDWGFHKEDTSLPIQMGMLATLLFVKGWLERRPAWLVSSGALFIASFLLFFRNILLTFCFAAALTLAIRSTSRIRKFICFGVAGLILLPSVLPFSAEYVLNVVEEKAPGLYELLPEGTQDTKTLMDRSIQLVTSTAVLAQSPVLGGGMGTEFTWSSDLGNRDQAFVDNGWAYLMVKMGCAGILAFGWLLITTLRCMSRESLAISISLLAILMITMFSEPVCFQFTMSPIAGALAGLLYAKKHSHIPAAQPSHVQARSI